jgi:hypothetical protein
MLLVHRVKMANLASDLLPPYQQLQSSCFSPTRSPDQTIMRHHLDSIIKPTFLHLSNRHGEVTAQAILSFNFYFRKPFEIGNVFMASGLNEINMIHPNLTIPWTQRTLDYRLGLSQTGDPERPCIQQHCQFPIHDVGSKRHPCTYDAGHR